MGEEGKAERSFTDAPGQDLLGGGIGIGALVLLVLSPWLVDSSGPDPFYKGPLIFPLIVLAVTVAGALPSMVRIARSGRLSRRIDGHGFPRLAASLFLLMCLFPFAIGAIGLQPATALLVFAGLKLVGRNVLEAAAMAAGLTLVIHLAFRTFLDIWFPAPWLIEALWG
ncbi:MAG: tripartite tricarboxylate transporter TctB family protein [Rhodomicrobiaceae bacterium]